MQRPVPVTPNRKDIDPGFYRRMCLYAPFVWMAMWVVRFGVRAGIVSPDVFGAYQPETSRPGFHRNRNLRRAMAACLRRAARCRRKHGRINPEDYTPRAYAHLPYVVMMDKTLTAGQFYERYLRDSGYSRVQAYGLDAAHRITGLQQCVLETFSGFRSSKARLSPQRLLPQAGPAPP